MIVFMTPGKFVNDASILVLKKKEAERRTVPVNLLLPLAELRLAAAENLSGPTV